jgi:hypothetical protein
MAAVHQSVSRLRLADIREVAGDIPAAVHQSVSPRLLVVDIPAAAEVIPVAVDTRVEVAAVAVLPHLPVEGEGEAHRTPDAGNPFTS